MVRIERSDRLRISRALDLGAGGLVVPRVESADDVRQALDWMRFPPQGQRGIALGGPAAQGFGAVGHADIGTLNDVVVGDRSRSRTRRPSPTRTRSPRMPGADVLFVGPADLSHSLGVPGQFDDPIYLDALEARPRRVRAPRQGGRDPALRRGGAAAPPRARVPVHRPRLGPRVRVAPGRAAMVEAARGG